MAEHAENFVQLTSCKDLCVGIVNSVTRSNREVKGLCAQAALAASYSYMSGLPVEWSGPMSCRGFFYGTATSNILDSDLSQPETHFSLAVELSQVATS